MKLTLQNTQGLSQQSSEKLQESETFAVRIKQQLEELEREKAAKLQEMAAEHKAHQDRCGLMEFGSENCSHAVFCLENSCTFLFEQFWIFSVDRLEIRGHSYFCREKRGPDLVTSEVLLSRISFL